MVSRYARRVRLNELQGREPLAPDPLGHFALRQKSQIVRRAP